jgi:hypothetical protein
MSTHRLPQSAQQKVTASLWSLASMIIRTKTPAPQNRHDLSDGIAFSHFVSVLCASSNM